MGKVTVAIKFTNYADTVLSARQISTDAPRSVETEALVDTGATGLYLRSSVIAALGLVKTGWRNSTTTNGIRRRSVFEPVQVDLMGRSGTFDVVEVDDTVPNLIGQIPLEYLDFVVDPGRRMLISNPAHGGEQMSEEY